MENTGRLMHLQVLMNVTSHFAQQAHGAAPLWLPPQQMVAHMPALLGRGAPQLVQPLLIQAAQMLALLGRGALPLALSPSHQPVCPAWQAPTPQQ